MRTSTKPALLGALAGVGLGAGALAMWRPASCDWKPCVGEACALDRLGKARELGLPDHGAIEVKDAMSARRREFARDPVRADVVHVRPDESPEDRFAALQGDLMARLLGDVEILARGYHLVAPSTIQEVEGGEPVYVDVYAKPGGGGFTRTFRFGVHSGRFFGMEDSLGGGRMVFQLNVRAGVPVNFVPDSSVKPRPTRPLHDFDTFLREVPFPVYEPAELPPSFVRRAYALQILVGKAGDAPLPLAWISYTDGAKRMHLFLASPENMRRLQARASQRNAAPGTEVCPTSAADTPEDLLGDGDDTVLVRRRDDGCRVVLTREMDRASVALVGFPGVSSDECLRMIRNLVHAVAHVPPPPKPTEKPLEPK